MTKPVAVGRDVPARSDRILWVLTDLFWCLSPMRMSILVLLMGFGVIFVADQGTDVLRLLAEDGRWLPFFAGVLFWATNTWYAARVVGELHFRPEPPVGDPARRHFLLVWLPRLLGGGVFLAVAAALLKASAGTGPLLADLVLGAAFLVFVWKRRALARRAGIAMEHEAGDRALSLRQASRPTLIFIAATIAISVALFLAAVIAPVPVGRLLTPGAVYLFASGSWIPVGTIMVVFSERYRLPVFALIAVAAFIFSAWNDNHAVRTGPKPQRAERPTIAEAYGLWLKNWTERHPGETPRPVVVATYGGGIRAAYWTAMTLARLQERIPDLQDRIFAVSGVSGGSVGAAAWRALSLRRSPTPAEVDRVLGQDYLGPTFATMFYPDLLQVFLPFPTGLNDRARTMEAAWESSWNAGSAYDGAFLDLWPESGRPWPALFLNGTSVNDGGRLVTSNLLPPPWRIKPYRDFITEFGPDLHVATAAGNSARFPLVSPAGSFAVAGRDKAAGMDQIVDGGYYDNSGGATAFNLISEMRNVGAGGHDIVAILITSDTEAACPPLGDPQRLEKGCAVPAAAKGEISAIVGALLNTRGAHTEEAAAGLQWTTGPGRNAWVRLSTPAPGCGTTEPPLGWVLSEKSRKTMTCRSTTAVEDAVRAIMALGG